MTKNLTIRKNFRISDFVVSIILLIASVFFINSVVSNTNASTVDQLVINGIHLNTPVENIELKDSQLIAPEKIAGAYKASSNKTLLIGHSTTVFKNLDQISSDMTIEYNGKTYSITDIALLKKEAINMFDLTHSAKEDTIVLMTCAGNALGNQDFTHRLIVTAVAK